MKNLIMLMVCVILAVGVAGCEEAFVAGGIGAIVVDAQDRFVESVNRLNEETAKINAGVNGIDGSILIKPETLEAIRGLKGREKDPVTWIALASIVANAVWGGLTLEKRKVKNGQG